MILVDCIFASERGGPSGRCRIACFGTILHDFLHCVLRFDCILRAPGEAAQYARRPSLRPAEWQERGPKDWRRRRKGAFGPRENGLFLHNLHDFLHGMTLLGSHDLA